MSAFIYSLIPLVFVLRELCTGFICPQCSAPRRRYAKKVGDQWGITRDGGDFPIYFMTFLGLAATTWFSLVYVPTL